MPKLDDAITEAEKAEETEVETPVKEEKPEAPKKEAEESEEDDDSSEADKAETTAALNLYKALKDPKSARIVIEALAKQVGLTPDASKTEIKAAKKSIAEIVKDNLGEEYSFMADKFGAAIEQAVEARMKDVEAKFAQQEVEAAKRETDSAVDWLYSKYEDAKSYEDQIVALMDELSIGKATPKSYMEKLYKLAKAEKGEIAAKAKLKAKIKETSNDATARLSSASDRGEEEVQTTSRPLSLDESLARASAELAKKFG